MQATRIRSGVAASRLLGLGRWTTTTVPTFSTKFSGVKSDIRVIKRPKFQSRSFHTRQDIPIRPNLLTQYARLLLGFVPVLFFLSSLQNLEAESPDKLDVLERKIRLSEVKKHGPTSERPWVIRGVKVYDITDWIQGHPGGEVILRAAGGSVDPYWKIFGIHQKQEVYDILEIYLIGAVDPQDLKDGAVPSDNIEDPFEHDPKRDPKLHQHTSRPCNAETPGEALATFITPNNVFYVRNHMWVPSLPPNTHLTIELPDGEEVTYTLKDLKEKFEQHTITSTLQCSGNRRAHMTSSCGNTSGLQWQVGAIGTATWTGPYLRDILSHAGFPVSSPPPDAKHIQFLGHEAYGASIPVQKAISPNGDVIIAHSMNHQPIPKDHGYPLRVIVPGHVAARSVKWLKSIVISDEESTSQWQRRDYKCFGPNEVGSENWETAKSIQEMPVNSAVTSITPRKEGGFLVKGWAYSGGGREIVRVDVSTDDGKSWNQATLELPEANMGSKYWAWKQWQYNIDTPKGGSTQSTSTEKEKMILAVKATDEAYNTQPKDFQPIYNARGNLAIAWHRVPVEDAVSVAKKERGGWWR
ncbi:hypothetical protein HYALB_00002584 [Hymenoscyphus albidus]|uniref:Nitrate reductase [NADPH] n=1 Tax=Hymenoscyphus albidus TaxID=595503 RepID=A0A9N9M019_9HELO|nr:hypothetical protein HYALB_00002584 [Hymenoscyphus albidus]